MNGERVAILEGQDMKSNSKICVDATRAYEALKRIIVAEGEAEAWNVRAFGAIVDGTLRVGFLAAKPIKPQERVVCIQV